jgi:hypothetical protein
MSQERAEREMVNNVIDTINRQGHWAYKLLLRSHLNMLKEIFKVSDRGARQGEGHDQTHQLTAYLIHHEYIHIGMTAKEALWILESELEYQVKGGQISKRHAEARVENFATWLQDIMTTPVTHAVIQQEVEQPTFPSPHPRHSE